MTEPDEERTWSVGAFQECAHSLYERLQIGVVDQGAGHPDGVAEEEALVENLAAAEGAAGDVPRQSIERDALFGGGVSGAEVVLDVRQLGGICEVGGGWGRHQRARAVELDDLDQARIQAREKIACGVERRSRGREDAPL